jgi:uncharacterized protein (DUF433 family)
VPPGNVNRRIEVHENRCYIWSMELPQHIEIRADVMLGKPCLKGTRIPVYLVLEKLAGGETAEQILAAYPQLTKDHITAALQYAAALAANEIVLAS